MYLALVPTERVDEPGMGSVTRPKLPAEFHAGTETHLWGQASSDWSDRGKVLVWLRPLNPSWMATLRSDSEYVVYKRVSGDVETGAMLAGLRAGDSRAARQAWVAAYRGEAAHRERLLRAVRVLEGLGAMVRRVAPALLIAWLVSRFGGDEQTWYLGLVVLHADNFNRSDRALSGDTMSDGLGAWANDVGAFSIATNQARATSVIGTADATAYDSAMTAVGTQRATIANQDAQVGSLARYNPAANTGYLSYRTASNAAGLYRVIVGSAYTLLGSGSSVSSGQTLGCDCDGSSISLLLDGSSDVGPVTDSTYATGVGGVYGIRDRDLDDWQVEVEAAGGEAPPSIFRRPPWFSHLRR